MKIERGQTFYKVEKDFASPFLSRVTWFVFQVCWSGYSSDHDSWEPERNIIDKSLIQSYLERDAANSLLAIQPGPGGQSAPHDVAAPENLQCMKFLDWLTKQNFVLFFDTGDDSQIQEIKDSFQQMRQALNAKEQEMLFHCTNLRMKSLDAFF